MRAFIKLVLLVLWMLPMMVLTTLCWMLHWESGRRRLTMITFRGVSRIFSLRVLLQGQLSTHRPLLIISNHNSYLDVLALGCCLPVSFTPKSEIRSWPVIGFCCIIAGCVFVDRTSKAIDKTRSDIEKRLQMGRVMCIFAEGTTGDGTHLKPFKSALFSLAEGTNVQIQPLALSYTARDGVLLDAQGRADIAWFGDKALLPHLWKVLNYKYIDASVRLLPPLAIQPDDTRKSLCSKSEAAIAEALKDT